MTRRNTVEFYEGARFHEQRYREFGRRLAHMGDWCAKGSTIPVERYDEARRRIAEAGTRIAEIYKATPVILVPAATGPAPRGLASTGDSRMNSPWTALGTPAITIPMPVGDALPLGLQLTAAHGQDARVIRTAVRLHADTERGEAMTRKTLAVLLVVFAATVGDDRAAVRGSRRSRWIRRGRRFPTTGSSARSSSVSIDAQDHVWVLQRPGTLDAGREAERRAAAARVRCRRQLRSGVGRTRARATSGRTPSMASTSIRKDSSGSAATATNDHQILKFTKAGKFVMQIGRAGQEHGERRHAEPQSAGRRVRPREDERAVRRRRLRQSPRHRVRRRHRRVQADVGRVRQRADGRRAEPAQSRRRRRRGASQFVQPVHAARVSKDGLVYVSDRGGKRVQVFTLDGTYVTQVFIGRECKAPDCGNGTTAASTAFSPDPEQRFLYVGNRSQAKVMVFDRKTLALLDCVRALGIGARRIRHAASHGRRFEGQSLRHRSHAAQAREPAHPEVRLRRHAGAGVRRAERRSRTWP